MAFKCDGLRILYASQTGGFAVNYHHQADQTTATKTAVWAAYGACSACRHEPDATYAAAGAHVGPLAEVSQRP